MKSVNLFIGTLSNGGAERVVSNLSINLNEDIKKNILLFGKSSKIDYPYNGKVIYLDKSEHQNLLTKLISFYSRILNIKKIKKIDKNATTISFLEYPNLINILTAYKCKSIVSVRNHMSTKHMIGMKARLWNATIKYLYPKADLIISVSEEIRRDLIKTYNINSNKIMVIYNSYNIDEIRESAKEYMESKYKEIFINPVIITAGRLNMQKGHWHLIRAFSIVKKKIPTAKLVILGEGALESYLKKLAKDLLIYSDIHFLGFNKNPFKYIAKSKIFVLSSLYEGFPNALAEAMACGIPVISTDCLSGPREILAPDEFGVETINYEENNGRYGILLPVCDGKKYEANDPITKEENEMANKIITLLKDKEQWNLFSKKSTIRIEDFNIKKIIRKWESVI